jgi:hypothetical protein
VNKNLSRDGFERFAGRRMEKEPCNDAELKKELAEAINASAS